MSNKINKICDNCSLLCPFSDDHLCDAITPQKIVLKNYKSTKDYLWCNGDLFKE